MESTKEPPVWQMSVIEPEPRRRWPAILGLLAAIALVAAGGFWLTTRGGGDELRAETISDPGAADLTGSTETAPAAPETGGAATDAGEEGDGTATGDETTETTAADNSASDDAENQAATAGDDGRPEGYEGDAPFAIFNGGVLTLYGKVPSQELYDRYEERFGNIVGPDNVVNKYVIDPAFELEDGQTTPVYVTDAVLFDFNSIALKPEYVYLLDYGALMLQQNPQATLTIVTYTDAVGDAETNMKVAQLRADQVLDYWVRNGVNPDQVLSDPRGEDGATDDDDEATAASRRRAEFIITGLLD